MWFQCNMAEDVCFDKGVSDRMKPPANKILNIWWPYIIDYIVSVGDVEWYLDCWWFACLRLRKFVEFLSGNFLFSCKKIITVENIYLYFLPTKLNGLPNWMGKSKFCCNAAWGGGLWFCGIFAWALFNGWSTILGIPRCPFGKDSTWKYRATNHQHRH